MNFTCRMSVAALTVGWAALAHAADDHSAEFVRKASMSNMFEIESSKLAQARASNPRIREFAAGMIDDHARAGKDMKEALAKSGLKLQPVTALDAEHREKLAEMREEKGEDFDEEYIEIQEDAHNDAVALFEDYAEHGKNAALRQFAATTLPTLRQHETRSNQLEDDIAALW